LERVVLPSGPVRVEANNPVAGCAEYGKSKWTPGFVLRNVGPFKVADNCIQLEMHGGDGMASSVAAPLHLLPLQS